MPKSKKTAAAIPREDACVQEFLDMRGITDRSNFDRQGPAEW